MITFERKERHFQQLIDEMQTKRKMSTQPQSHTHSRSNFVSKKERKKMKKIIINSNSEP
jgi:hypothetical protein